MDYNEETILPGQEAHSDHTSLEYYRPNKRVSLDVSGFIYTFTDFPVYTLRVNNALDQNVNLLGNGWLEDDMMGITPGSAQDANHTGTVYSSNPTFTAVTSNGFPARIYFTITGSVMYATIVWQ
jgi:hypothetical protein